MQLEDKLVEDREAALAEVQDREELEERGEDQLPAPVTEALHDATAELRNQLLGAIRMVLDGERLSVRDLRLPKRESTALESLQVAVTGRSDLDQFVYAEDRRDLLEQALAVLQPNLTRADELSARELHAQFADLTERVAELRAELSELEEAQDEREPYEMASREHGPAEPADKPKPKPSDPDAPRPPTTLTGPALAGAPKPPTTLTGPDLPPEPEAPTTLTGPDLPPEPEAPTTLTGPDLPPEPEAPTTLTGPELVQPVKPPSSLGDPDELAARAKLPWWRRPFG